MGIRKKAAKGRKNFIPLSPSSPYPLFMGIGDKRENREGSHGKPSPLCVSVFLWFIYFGPA